MVAVTNFGVVLRVLVVVDVEACFAAAVAAEMKAEKYMQALVELAGPVAVAFVLLSGAGSTVRRTKDLHLSVVAGKRYVVGLQQIADSVAAELATAAAVAVAEEAGVEEAALLAEKPWLALEVATTARALPSNQSKWPEGEHWW